MKRKIGTSTCVECEYPDADVGLDKNEHPYSQCYSTACGGEQYFTKGKPHKVRRLVIGGHYRPIAGGPSAAELLAKYGIENAAPVARGPEPAPAPKPEPKPAPKPAAKAGATLLG